MTRHDLRTWPVYFEAVAAGTKTFEVRWDDRGFQAGDTVLLREWDNTAACDCRSISIRHLDACARYTGRALAARIGYVMTAMHSGNRQPFSGNGYAVFSLVDVEPADLMPNARPGRAVTPLDLDYRRRPGAAHP